MNMSEREEFIESFEEIMKKILDLLNSIEKDIKEIKPLNFEYEKEKESI